MWESKKIENGIVIDHIPAGKAFKLYNILKLNSTDYTCIIIKNIDSKKMGKKDIIKIWGKAEIDLDIIGYFYSGITVNIIENQKIFKINDIESPPYIKNILYCKNINCITCTEPEIDHIFKLTSLESKKYSCIYCDCTE